MMEKLNEKYVTVSGISIRYVITGTGPSVLLIHGFTEFLEVWWFNIATLSKYFTVYALDLPGHGHSEETHTKYTLGFSTSFIIDFMQTMGIEQVSLIGHSSGGPLGLDVAIRFPGKVDKLVLVGSGGFSKETPLRYRLASLPILGDILIRPMPKAAIKLGMKRRFYNPAIITEEWVDMSYKYLKMPKMKGTMLNILRSNTNIYGQLPDVILTDRLHLVKSPTLIIHGAHDSVMPIEDARNVCNLIPNARFKMFDECNHNPHIEKAAEFNETVIEFLSGGP